MAIVVTGEQRFLVSDVRSGNDDRGTYLTWLNAPADVFVVCLSKEGVRAGSIVPLLGDVELRDLYRCLTIQKTIDTGETVTLSGVAFRQFNTTSRYRDFDVPLPAVAQVWALKQEYGEGTLYLPDTDMGEACLIPQVCRYSFVPAPMRKRSLFSKEQAAVQPSVLHVQVSNLTGYSDGDLEYRVGSCLSVPLPRALLNSDIPLYLRNTDVSVEVCAAADRIERYVCMAVN